MLLAARAAYLRKISSMRRESGSASARRLAASSNPARLFRRKATLRWSGPDDASSIASARRNSTSASAWRLVA